MNPPTYLNCAILVNKCEGGTLTSNVDIWRGCLGHLGLEGGAGDGGHHGQHGDCLQHHLDGYMIYIWKDNKNVTLCVVKCFLLLPVEKCLVWWSPEGSIPVLYPSDHLPSFSNQAGKPGLFKFPDTNQPQTPGTNHAFDTSLSLGIWLLTYHNIWKYI